MECREYNEEREFMVEIDDLVSIGGLSDILNISIKESGEVSNIYGPESLENWEDEKDLPLSYIDEGSSKTFEFTVSMPSSAGDEYQDKSSGFNLTLGYDVEEESGVLGAESSDTKSSFFSKYVGAIPSVSDAKSGDENIEETSQEDAPSVGGTKDDFTASKDDKCLDPWWWFLVFVAQIAVHSVVHFVFEDDKKLYKALFQFLIGALFVFVFWENFCPAWDYWLAGLVSLVFSPLSFTDPKTFVK